ncbi:glucosamine-6-phosphate deaminase [Staphylococcus casei]|uniref:glucosamine-6-phosphate deaminase n=1 Tax=Staphylococcus casei TaxID=201828 RepID=UPI000CD01E08|nr:glucosamine-6-phosphate deaminase [Staphylococcus casei]PNZ56909.1 glucosamine-6-phosphate deaminase [Staphylococcus casei]PTI74104.1 glucosamine-6-phosphate deaminase [Staphylococcus succinus]WJE86659.1 glucosamine-6-phosphate deaminase [Staphylococcus casei]
MNILNLKNRTIASQYVATELIKVMKAKPNAVLGLATGSTMTDVYRYLVTLINANEMDLNSIITFNLDEYIGLAPNHEQSYYTYMHEHLFNHHESWNKSNLYVPNGIAKDLQRACSDYEQALRNQGPADIQILGIGENGHIGFNEPYSSFDSQTRVVNLTESTIHANSYHFSHIEDVPKQAISMGLDSIMSAKRIILLALGSRKKDIVKQLIEGQISEKLPASILHHHGNVEIIVDDEAYVTNN